MEFYRHNVDESDIANAAEATRETFLTTGERVARFERDLAAWAGRRHAVGVASCTGGLHIALASLGLRPGDEVITTPMSFVATANAIVMTGARPVFVDVEESTGNLDARLIDAITPRTRAILPVHLYGVMCDMREIARIARERRLALVEDAAHALEARRDGVAPGELSDAAVLSFYATKSITSGEGGAVLADSPRLDARLRSARLHGVTRGAAERYGEAYAHYDMTEFGWKYNMTNIQAALLAGQLTRADALRERRAQIARRYLDGLAAIPSVRAPETPDGALPAWHLFTVRVGPEKRDRVLKGLEARGVGVAVNYRPIHLMTWYRRTYGMAEGAFPNAERLGASTVTLPLYPKLADAEVDYVLESLARAVALEPA